MDAVLHNDYHDPCFHHKCLPTGDRKQWDPKWEASYHYSDGAEALEVSLCTGRHGPPTMPRQAGGTCPDIWGTVGHTHSSQGLCFSSSGFALSSSALLSKYTSSSTQWYLTRRNLSSLFPFMLEIYFSTSLYLFFKIDSHTSGSMAWRSCKR